MDLRLDGYRVERMLRSSGTSRVWSAVRERDQLPVIAKSFTVDARPDLEARVEHEFGLIRGIDCAGVVRALALERSGRELVLVLEAHPGVDLREYVGGRALPVDEFLTIATRVTEILAEVHQRRVIHRDLKPANILIDPQTGSIALADFGISALLDSERGHIHERSVMEGTLPYMAPEQTGRTSREVDVRSDLYSLGVTFYELLTGQRPFEADTPLELIHAHFARRPRPPQRLRPELPTMLSELVMKLLEKAPERRYQSARGLAADLARLQAQLAAGQLDAFELGASDLASSLQLPHQLYGREHECEQIRAALMRAVEGQPQFLTLVGPSGIGKSALLDVIVEPVLARRGFVARGKCEDESGTPFSSLVAALGGVIDQLLTESSEQLAEWRERIGHALSGYAAAICELLPRLRALLGDVGPSVPLGPAEARNHMHSAFSRLLAELARREHPLVLAIDDLQWLDAASVELLDSLLGQRDQHDMALLLLATAREAALEPGSRLRELLARLDAREPTDGVSRPSVIHIGPLGQAEIEAMLADVLAQPVEAVAPLARVVSRKTGNNPFFARQFLLLLVELGLLERGPTSWRWDLDALEQAALPEDALEMMMAKLDRLDAPLRELMCVASVCGSRFEAALVEQVIGGDAVMGGFQRLIEEGLLSPIAGHGLLFAHDRIREAAYALLGPARQRALHLAIGEALLRGHEREPEQQVFEIAEHLDRGHGLLDELDATELDEARFERLVELNLAAGQRALQTGAPEATRPFLDVAGRLLAAHEPFPARDQPRHVLHFEVGLARAQAATLLGLDDDAEAVFDDLLARELDDKQLGRVAVARIWQMVRKGERAAALRWGLGILRTLGVTLPLAPNNFHAAMALPRMIRLARRTDPMHARARAPITDARVCAAIDVILALNGTSYVVSPAAFVLLTERHGSLIDSHGDHPTATLALAQVGLVVGGALGWRSEAVELCRRCLAATDAGGPNPMRYRVHITVLFAELWSENLLDIAAGYAEVVERALEVGDVETASSALLMRVELSLWGGVHLRTLRELAQARRRWIAEHGASEALGSSEPQLSAAEQLLDGPPPNPALLRQRLAAAATATKLARIETWSHVLKSCFVLGVFGRFDELLPIIADIGPKLEHAVPGTWYGLTINVLLGVAAAEQMQRASTAGERRRWHRQLRRCHHKLAKQQANGANLAHGVELLAGELAGVRGDLAAAGRAFARARACAAAQRNPMFEALACERAAAVTLRLTDARMAMALLADARASYLRWGAFAKVEQLEHAHPELTARAARSGAGASVSESSHSHSSSSTTSKALDHATLLEASQTIAEDIRLDEVVARVLRLAVENAGAERSVLILRREGRLGLAAEHDGEHPRAELLAEPLPLSEVGDRVPVQVLRWVARTHEPVVLADAATELRFASDPYLQGAARSVLCTPIIKHGELIGLLYLDNHLSAGAFTPERLETLRLLAAQAGSALENAQLYDELRASEVRWRSLVEQLPDYVALIRRDGTLELANDRRSSSSAWTARFELERHRATLEPLLQDVFDDGRHIEIELRGSDDDTSTSQFVVRAAPIVLDGAIARALVVATDVSERRQAEAARAELEAQLRQQQRLESIGTLASGVAHEINNPVQGIMNYAELIAGSPRADDSIREFAGEIEHESKRVATIVRNLLAFSRQEREAPLQRTSASAIVDGTVSLLRAVLRKDQIELCIEYADELPEIDCRPQQIQQVLMNLATNARDALNARYVGFDEHKRITIAAERCDRDARAWVRISVADLGGGVPEHLVARIFDPFFTTKGRDQGTGLGLAVSHGIVADHGGELRLDNHPGRGARFCIELPAAIDR